MSDSFLTTVVGSMPKPSWLQAKTAMNAKESDHHGAGASWELEDEILREAHDDAVRVAIHDQEKAGVDIISDGEQRRQSYLTYVTMQMGGIDYKTLAEKWIRNGRRLARVGRCVESVYRKGPMVVDDLRFLMAEADSQVKVSLPGPMTVVDTVFDTHYGDERAFALDVATVINEEACALDALGPAVIQIDEPVFSRYPEKVAEWGIEALDRCLEGLQAETAVHVCYSYPMPGVPRPISDSYPVILKELERSQVNQLALEFEASGLEPELLRLCPSKTILFGCIDNGINEVETPEHVASKLLAAAKHHPPEKLQAAPDCGLVPLVPGAARAKLAAMVEGARLARSQL